MLKNIFFSPDPAPGSPADPPAPAPAAPPAATTVLNGPRSERETALESELATERNSHAKTAKEKKDREARIAELEDELHRLRQEPKPASKGMWDDFFED